MDAAPELVISGLSLGIAGGMGVYTRRLLRALDAVGRRYVVLLPEMHRALADGLREETLHWIGGRPPFRHSLGAEIWWQQRLGRYAATRFPDQTFIACTDFFALRHPRDSRVVIHDGLMERRPRDAQRALSPRRVWRRLCMQWAARRARAVLTVSAWSARELSTLAGIPASKIRVCHPWLDASYARPATASERQAVRAAYSLPERYWLYLGGFRNYKNVDRLLAVYARQKDEPHALPLVVAGELPSAPQATLSLDVKSSAQRHGLQPGEVCFPGAIRGDLLPALYAESELYIFPSLYEGFGYPPVEASAAGAAVIASNAASLPEVLGPQLACFDGENETEILEVWRRAALNPAAYRKPFDERFSEARGVQRWLEAVDSAAPAP